MDRFEQIDDVETLKQVARLLEAENRRLHERMRELIRRLATLEGADGRRQLELELEDLQVQLERLQKRMFAASSEKRSREASPPAAPPPKRGHGPRPQLDLPRVAEVHDLAPDDRACPTCEGTLEPMGDETEDADEVTVVRRQFVVVTHKRKKYRCRCNAAVVTAPAPPKLIAGGRYSVDFAVSVAVDKYLDHAPLERQARAMGRDGLVVDSQTLWDQILALAGHLEPSYEALHRRALTDEVLGADETWWRLMDRSAGARWWAWCLASRDAVFYRILPSRSGDAAKKLLGDYRGVVVCDGYGAYDVLARGSPGLVLAHCWAHVRRKFVEIEAHYPAECGRALDLIGQLYAVERAAPPHDRLDGDERPGALALRARLRADNSRPVIDELLAWARAQRSTRESALRKAVEYMTGMWPGLVRFLDDPRIPLDNNRTERSLRGSVVGRKNHYGSRSERGTKVAALFYSLVETAKLCGVDEASYLREAAVRAIRAPGAVLLPHELAR